ncbi:MAG: family 20 glycosylhydrolase [bacterium]|nr:family 20 glycosylhydrolase [bacterium]
MPAAIPELCLVPIPRSIEFAPGRCMYREDGRMEFAREAGAAADRVSEVLATRGTPDGGVTARISEDSGLPPEGFELTIGERGVEILAGDRRGLLWGLATLEQILLQSPSGLPHLRIRDFPDFAERGYMIDVSRDRVPTRETLGLIVDLLAGLRFNQLQLYTEHSFAYANCEIVWRDASPMTPEDIRWLDALCHERGIELIPNQNSFGHMERWLKHDAYRHLGELPEASACLRPGAESLAFMRERYEELLPCFGSRTLNIGCDETFELGQGRSKTDCETRGHGRVYLDFLLELISGLRAKGHHVQFWGDIIAKYPELAIELPSEGVTALAWGYSAPFDPESLPARVREVFGRFADLNAQSTFHRGAAPFADSGIPFSVCPGTSSWNSLIGRLPNALGNLLDAAEAGKPRGARGFLITDWGDNGHLQPLSISLPPLVYGAAVAWCAESARGLDLETALNRLVLRDPSGESGRALLGLGKLYELSGLSTLNASPLFNALIRPLGSNLLSWGETSPEKIHTTIEAIDEQLARLERSEPRGFGGEIVKRELGQAAALARHGARRLGFEPNTDRNELRRELSSLIEEQAATWRARSREGGLVDSLARLRARLVDYD